MAANEFGQDEREYDWSAREVPKVEELAIFFPVKKKKYIVKGYQKHLRVWRGR